MGMNTNFSFYHYGLFAHIIENWYVVDGLKRGKMKKWMKFFVCLKDYNFALEYHINFINMKKNFLKFIKLN